MPHEAKLELYQVHAVTEGTNVQTEVSEPLAEDGRSYAAKGADPDTLVASKHNKPSAIERRIHANKGI